MTLYNFIYNKYTLSLLSAWPLGYCSHELYFCRKERPRQKLNMLAPWSWTFSLQTMLVLTNFIIIHIYVFLAWGSLSFLYLWANNFYQVWKMFGHYFFEKCFLILPLWLYLSYMKLLDVVTHLHGYYSISLWTVYTTSSNSIMFLLQLLTFHSFHQVYI